MPSGRRYRSGCMWPVMDLIPPGRRRPRKWPLPGLARGERRNQLVFDQARRQSSWRTTSWCIPSYYPSAPICQSDTATTRGCGRSTAATFKKSSGAAAAAITSATCRIAGAGPAFRDSGALSHLFPNAAERRFWASIWELLHRHNQPDTWDYQWNYTVMANGGLAAMPNVNLASNIGFDADGTDTNAPTNRLANRPSSPLRELLHPAHVLHHSEADDYFVHQHLAPPAPAMSSAIPLPDPSSPRPRLQVALNEGERLAVDIGCGGKPRNPFNAERLIGLDVMTNQERVYACVIGYEPLPLDDSSVVFISAFDFIEHLPRTAVVNSQLLNPFIDTMSEIWRVLKPGGLFFAQTPAYPSMAAP